MQRKKGKSRDDRKKERLKVEKRKKCKEKTMKVGGRGRGGRKNETGIAGIIEKRMNAKEKRQEKKWVENEET